MTILTKKLDIKYDSIKFEQSGVVFRAVFIKDSHVLFTTRWFGMGDGHTLILSGIKGKLKFKLLPS